MHTITSTTVVAITARANDITVFASLELSKSKWVVTINSPGSRRIAIVALARKLLVAWWRFVTQGVVPEGAVLKAA
jgi:hypothetical protein